MRVLLSQLVGCWKLHRSGRFDREYYRQQEGVNRQLKFPLWHYVRKGWSMGLNPNGRFDTDWYLETYPDVRRGAARYNPFLHYLEDGFGEARQGSPSGVDYEDWIAAMERYDAAQVQRDIEAMAQRPTFSILVPVYRPDAAVFQQCLDSVLAQSYPHWQLCLADDASGDAALARQLLALQEGDPRISVCLAQNNGHIAVNSNRALELASGEFVVLLDQDDLLAPHALYEVARRINRNPAAAVIYSDEDKLDEQGVRHRPHFKPDWNRDLLYSVNYVSHLGVYRRSLIQQLGGFRQGYEGAQDYDLVLRCIAELRDDQIEHIPLILYHWRASEGSTALSSDDKSYTWAAGERVLQDHLSLHHPGAVAVRGALANTFQVRWPLPQPEPLVTLIVPTRDGGKVMRRCVDSLLQRTAYGNFELLLLDNQSSAPDTLAYFEKLAVDARVRIERFDEPFNFSRMMNFAAQRAGGDILALVNDDVEVIEPDWLREMAALAWREDAGCVGAKLYYPDDTIQHAGVVLGIKGVASHAFKHFPRSAAGYFGRLLFTQQYSAVTAACLLVRKGVYERAGGMDEENLAIAFNDIDFCLKVRELGLANLWTPRAELYHHESLSRGYEDTPEKQARFASEVHCMQRRWGGQLQTDPAYNRNLSLMEEDFSLRIPDEDVEAVS